MALAAVKTFIANEVLFASDLNALNTNILDNGLSVISPLTGTLDCNSQQLTNATLTTPTLSGAAPATPVANRLYADLMPKAWCRFDGTAAGPISPTADVNVTDITDNGTGDYTINFTTALANANYAVLGTSAGSRLLSVSSAAGLTTTSARMTSRDDTGTLSDAAVVCVLVMGTQ